MDFSFSVKAGTLVLNSGQYAWRRLSVGGGVDGDETFSITQLSGDANNATIQVTAFGVSETYYNVKGIFF